MRTWRHSGFSIDQSVFLPAGAQAGIELEFLAEFTPAFFALAVLPCRLSSGTGIKITISFRRWVLPRAASPSAPGYGLRRLDAPTTTVISRPILTPDPW